MGPGALDWIGGLPDHEALLVSADGAVTSTPGFDRLLP
jgi:hypothetical protein